MIQTRKTGSTISCLRPRTADRARLPVTMPRNSDSDMCRAGQSIASMQSDTGLDEHGRLHGVSDLSNDFADLRTSASNSWSFSAKERKRRWRILAQKRSQIRLPDKIIAGRVRRCKRAHPRANLSEQGGRIPLSGKAQYPERPIHFHRRQHPGIMLDHQRRNGEQSDQRFASFNRRRRAVLPARA